MLDRDRIFTLSAAALCVVYVTLRFWGVADSCLWFDEIFSVHAAEHSVSGLFWFVAQDLIHPPLFYLLLKGWIALGGDSVFWLRAFSVFFSCAVLAPFLLLCKELKLSFTARLVALAFFAANGSLIKYAQEVRMYGLLLFLSLISTWLFTRFFFRGKNIWLLTLVNALMVYTHYYGWLVVTAEIAVVLVFQRIKIRHVLVMFGILLASYVPWIWAILQAAGGGSDVRQNIGWIERPGLRALIDFVVDAIEPFYYQETSVEATTVVFVTAPLLLMIAAATLYYIRTRRNAPHKKTLALLATLAVVPLATAIAASWVLPVSIWGTRHLIIVIPTLIVAFAVLFDAVRHPAVRAAVIGTLAFFFCVAFVMRVVTPQRDFIWCAWEQQAASLPVGQFHTVYAFEDLIAYHIWFATRSRPEIKIVKIKGVEGMTEDAAYFLPRGFDAVETAGINAINGDLFWLAFRDVEWNENHPPVNLLMGQYSPVGDPFIINAQGHKAILVKMGR